MGEPGGQRGVRPMVRAQRIDDREVKAHLFCPDRTAAVGEVRRQSQVWDHEDVGWSALVWRRLQAILEQAWDLGLRS